MAGSTRKELAFGWIASIAFALGCTASSNAPSELPVAPAPRPIELGAEGSHPLTFHKVVYRIPSGTVLGEARREGGQVVDELRWTQPRNDSVEFNVAITDALRARGYDVRDAADALFDPGLQYKVRYRLAAIVNDADLDFEYQFDRRRNRVRNGRGTAKVDVEVRLHDSIRNEVVYRQNFVGHGEDEGLKPSPIMSAVVNAVLGVADDPEFVRLLSLSADVAAAPEASRSGVTIAPCRAADERSLPDDLPEVLQSIVEIQAGGSAGTGVVISPDGWVLTAAHVVDGAAEVWVRLDGGAQVPASIEISDARSDVALIRIPGRNHPCAQRRGADEELRLGSDVFAINFPVHDGRTPTITRGVVSGFPQDAGQRYIQTDASVNPGSSGGPLLASDGTVAGLTVKKLIGLGFEGIGFAIPIEEVVDRLAISQPID